jgi:DNA-binding transcriptional LysR family regulator
LLNDIDLSRADLNLLVVFEAVLQARHVGRAATTLDLTPSAVSHGLRRLRAMFDDPLFLRTPKGVVPTARATELARPIADILARVRNVIATASPFDPSTSTRRFALGAPDATVAVILPGLLARLRRDAPGIDLTMRHLLPSGALPALETRAIDIAIVQIADVPARFVARTLYEEDFVIAARAGHPFLKTPTLSRYCEMRHALVSVTGEARGHIDIALEKKGLTRRVVLSAPSFMLALAAVSETDLVAAVPRSLVATHGARFGLASVEVPVTLARGPLLAIAPEAAMMDAGLAWLLDVVEETAKAAGGAKKQRRGATRIT